ncbi:dermonecrotic toxin domain-containing protein [Pseudomonas orientalis]|uniref:dermonecrotic toxin domain-containing protein n=1 Tax=Pseudomonas orientalis TaxID=76758 RepID=UPI000F57D18C|nr:DUF6543 domain-containing protein [Pseudomonas orientalis]AZE90430.1 hypothetical protein C4J97_3747 [Pseudomonas orientalis]
MGPEPFLLDRLNTTVTSSRQLNELYLAHARCADRAHVLQRMQVRAPRISRLIRQTLRDTFQMDPDSLLLNVPLAPDEMPWRRSLTDTVMRLLAERACVREGKLSQRACQSRQLADAALSRVLKVDLLARIESAAPAFWQVLAEDRLATREAYWFDLYHELIGDQALLAHGLNQLSEDGLAMVMTVVEAPTAEQRTRAGGLRADLRVAQVVCPGKSGATVPFCGALHLYYEADPAHTRQVLFLPGLESPFYEFETHQAWQSRFPELVTAQAHSLWPLLALRRRHELPDVTASSALPMVAGQLGPLVDSHALEHSARALLHVQWDNEMATLLDINIAYLFPGDAIKGAYMQPVERLLQVEQGRKLLCMPAGLNSALAHLLSRDQHEQHVQISFASLSHSLPLRLREQKQQQYEKALTGLLDDDKPSEETVDFKAFTALHQQWLEQRQQCAALLEGHEHRLDDEAFWAGPASGEPGRRERLLAARGAALINEAQLMHRLKFIDEHLLAQVRAVVEKPSQTRALGAGRVLSVTLGGGTQPAFRLLGVFVVAGASDQAHQATLLYMPGLEGGLQRFKSLPALTQRLQASFMAREPSTLWQCIGRAERNAARNWARCLPPNEAVTVGFADIDGDVLLAGLKEQVKGFADARQKIMAGERVFTEVSDATLATTLLAAEVAQSLQVPAHDVREMALNNLQIVMAGAALATGMPAWYEQAPVSISRRHARLVIRQQRSALNLQRELVVALGSVEAFARPLLIRQLTLDGLYPELDIDQPMFDIPDDVSKVPAGHPERLPAEGGTTTFVSKERTTYSFLQLALNNLDPQAPWTVWRLKRMRYLVPGWKARLNVDYLIKTISNLDIGGHYDRKILSVCYGEGDIAGAATHSPLRHELLRRPVRRRTKIDLIGARQLKLSEEGLKLFSRAIAIQHDAPSRLRLCFLRVEAVTVPWARHIAGMVVIQDPDCQCCVFYWPTATNFPALSEHASLDTLRETLTRHWQRQENIAELAKYVAPGSETQALGGYPGAITPVITPETLWRNMLEQLQMFTLVGFTEPKELFIARRLYRWFKSKRVFPATALSEIEMEIREQQEVMAAQWLGITETDARDMVAALAHAQVLTVQRLGRAESNSRASLEVYRRWRLGEQKAQTIKGLLSMIPFVSIGVLLHDVLLAARRLYHSGEAANGVDLSIAIHQLVLDIALTFAPFKVGPGAKPLKPVNMRPMRLAFNQLHRGQHIQSPLSLRPPSSPMTFKGLEPYKLPGLASDAIELKGPVSKGSRLQNGEQFVTDAKGERYQVYQRDGERQLRFKNAQTPGDNELILNIKEPRQWLLGADAPEPQPGPSSRATPFWQQTLPPSKVPVSWTPPPVASAEQLGRRPHNLTSAWRNWGQPLGSRKAVELAPHRKIFTMEEVSHPSLKVGDQYYETLPGGSRVDPDVVFLKPPGSLMDSIDSISMLLGDGTTPQPVLFTYGEDLRWTAREALFNQPLSASISARFPELTRASARHAARRLVELADPGERALTSTRLLRIRAALDEWRPQAPGQTARTDDLIRMLRPLQPRKPFSLYVGADGQVGNFERMDFNLPSTFDRSLFVKPKGRNAITQRRVVASLEQATRILQQQGFAVERLNLVYAPRYPHLLATHPASNKLYYIMPKWLDGKSMPMKLGARRLLSNDWFLNKSQVYPALYRQVIEASNEGRLVKLIAGVQNVRTPTIYFIRPGEL